MKYSLLISLLPLLVVATPDDSSSFELEKRSPNPQFLGLIPLAVGGLTLGAFNAAALKGLEGAAECSCGRNFSPPPCTGASLCECQNTANIACWANKEGKCKINLKVCPSGNGQSGSPTSLNSPYPPCGQNLPACSAAGQVCQKLDATCRSRNSAGCIGLCIPNFTKAKAPAPKAAGSSWIPKFPAAQGAAAQATKCPSAYQCAQDQVCVPDPHNVQARTSPSYKCVAGQAICGGFQSTQCPAGGLCVTDPRNQCTGQGCTGLCA